MKKCFIRKTTINDLEKIYEIELNSFAESRRASIETLETRIKLFPEGCFVSLYNNKLLGFSTALLINNLITLKELDPEDSLLHTDSGEVYYLRSVAVHKKFWKSGFGKKLVEKQLENAKKLKKKSFRFTASKDVEGFYIKLGFKRITDFKEFHGRKQAIWNKDI